ncbi:MAG: hypothetical protein ABI683_05665 [Ginsengibacter sp.]
MKKISIIVACFLFIGGTAFAQDSTHATSSHKTMGKKTMHHHNGSSMKTKKMHLKSAAADSTK